MEGVEENWEDFTAPAKQNLGDVDNSSNMQVVKETEASTSAFVMPFLSEEEKKASFQLPIYSPDQLLELSHCSNCQMSQDETMPAATGYSRKIKPTVEQRRERIHKVAKSLLGHIQDKQRLKSAVEEGNASLCQQLLRGGADANYQDDKKRSLLHIASTKVAMLLEHGADPNKRDMLENTPLHLAACTSQIPVVTELLKGGAEVGSVDMRGNTPFQLARGRLMMLSATSSVGAIIKKECTLVIEMLREYLHRRNEDSEKLTSFQERCEGTQDDLSELQQMLEQMTTND